jgi:ABC-2 type transport system ATP-binding protein
MNEQAIVIEGLEKLYRSTRRGEPGVHALRPLELTVNKGEVFGLLGPNGAGKTTLVKLLLGVVFPTSGKATILSEPIGTPRSKRSIGYLPENHRYPGYLTAGRALDYFGTLSGIDKPTRRRRTDELLRLVNMSEWRTTRVKKYSKGMMQRLGLAQSLINDPDVVFLDEPTDGVDPIGRKEIRDVILRLRNEGKTIFLNSHLLSEVELICDRVAIVNHGSLKRIGSVRELTESDTRFRVTVDEDSIEKLQSAVATVANAEVDHQHAILPVGIHDLNAVIDVIRSAGGCISEIIPMRKTLEEIFIELIELDEEGK